MEELLESLLETRLYDPFALLGLHQEGAEWVIRVYEPNASDIALLKDDKAVKLKRIDPSGVFEWRGKKEPVCPYRLRMYYGDVTHDIYDPYQFPPHPFTAGSIPV